MIERAPRQRRSALAARLALGVLAVGSVPRAWAGASLQAQITASAGVTDNVTASPNVPDPGTRGRQSDLIVTLNPTLIFTTGQRRVAQQLTYSLGGIIYARNVDASSYSNTLSWAGFFIPGKTTTMRLSFSLGQARLSAFNNAIPSADAAPQLRLPGITNVLNINAGQELSWDISANWRLTQTLGFSTAYFLDQDPPSATTQAVPARLAIERAFSRAVAGIAANLLYTRFLEVRGPITDGMGNVIPDGVVSPETGQIVVTPTAFYRRDLTYFMSGRAELGAIVVFDPSRPASFVVQPGGGAGLNFFSRRRLNFDLAYQYIVVPNLLFRSNFFTHQVTARLGVLLSERHNLSLSLGGGYAHLDRVALDSADDPSILPTAPVLTGPESAHVVSADATLAYQPLRVLSIFLRYQLINQIGSDVRGDQLRSYYVNTLVFGLTATYPTEVAAEIPRGASGVRADRRDDGGISSSRSTPR